MPVRHASLPLAALTLLLTASFSLASDRAPLLDYRDITLENGLRVLTLEDRSTPIVNVQLWYHVGSKDENPERQGFAHMFEHMMFRGTDRLGPKDHFEFLRRVGGDANAYTSFDNTTYHQTVPSHQLELALWLEAERMTHLKIDQESFDTERKVVEEERRMGVNRPYGTVLEDALTKIFPENHPYRWSPIGNIPMLRAAEVSELREFWTRWYVPNNATLVIVGDVSHEQAQQAARRYFGWIPRYPDPARAAISAPQRAEAGRVTIKADSAPAPVAGVVFRTVPVGHDDAVVLEMLAAVLGGGESSRLHRAMVAEGEVAVAAVAAALSLQSDGLFAAGAALAPMSGGAKIRKSADLLNEHLQRMRDEPVSEAELEKVRNQMLRGIVTELLSVESKASRLGSAAVLEGDPARANRRLERVRAVTAADIQRVARQHLAPERALELTIEQNLLGSLFGSKKAEEEAPITGKPETDPPVPGRPGLSRPADWPATAPLRDAAAYEVRPTFSRHKLSNGMRVVVVPDREAPFVSLALNLRNGSFTESKIGAATMAAQLITKGTENYVEAVLARELETYAISLGGSADTDAAAVNAGCLAEHLPRAMTLMAEVVRRPTFPKEEFRKLREQVRTGLAISTATPEYVAQWQMRRLMYGAQHPYSRSSTGELADVVALSEADCATWWRMFVRPDVATLYIAGDVDDASAVALAEKAFGDWKAEGNAPTIAVLEPQPAAPKIYLVDRPGVQAQIRVGCLAIDRTHPDYFAGRVVSSYFGGAFNSRLNDTIRVKLGLTYGASGGLGAQRFGGSFMASTFTKTESTAQTVQAVIDEIRRLRTDPPTERELSDTKAYVLGSFPGDRETPQQVAAALWMLELNGLPDDYYEQMLARIASTTAADCTRVVTEHLDPAQMVIVVVGNADALQPELEKLGPVERVTRAVRAASEEAASDPSRPQE
ncbi:MAG: insulinase family protein [Phycisphaerales bacterium]|nr:insulinase family protein [Phycisphaerales bacterium]